MTGNPLSGHTAANQASMTGSGVFTDSLEDGEHITSPSLTNMLEGVHGNGIILEEDTASTASIRDRPEDLPGVCEQVAPNPHQISIQGGHAILDGVLYDFANGYSGASPSSIDIKFNSTSPHYAGVSTPSALTSGQEALIVVYISSDTTNNCISWEIGTPVTTASNTYPTTPSAFLSNPKSGLDVTQTIVLAVIRVVYVLGSGDNDLNISITESNDKRVFVRPNPMYLTPVTTGTVGNKTAVDSHTALDSLHTDNGNFTTSRLGALWQSYNSDGDTILYYSANDSNDDRHTHVLGPVGYVSASPSATTTFTFNEGQVFVLNPSTAIQFNPSGTFPPGHKVFVTNEAAHGANSITFDNAGIGIVLQGKESGLFVYTGSAWKNVMLASGAISPNGHGASGLIQISDGAGGFTSDADLSWDAVAGELTIDGKLTVTGLIDPTGLELVPQADNPGGDAANTLWLDEDDSDRLKHGALNVMRENDNISELNNDAGFTDAAAASAAAPVQSVNTATGAVVLDADDIDDTSTTKKFTTAADISKLAGIETGATADQTAAEIKTAYESNADTNAFTDAEQTKLAGIATGAEVNVNADWSAVGGDAEILNKPTDVTNLSTHSVTELSDITDAGSGAIITSAERTTLGTALQAETDPVFSASPAASITNAGSGAVITSAERTKLTGIETGATADQDADEVPVTASPSNYTAATADVEAHLVGIDNALASAGSVSSVFGRTGAVVATSGDYDDGEITAAASATNYTPTASTVEGHLAGIDTALGSVGGGGTPSGAAGAIQFSDGSAFDDDGANLHWDDGNNRLGVGTNSPENALHVKTTVSVGDAAYAARFQAYEGNVGVTRYGGIHLSNDNTAPIDGDAWESNRWQIGQRDGNQLDFAYGGAINTNIPASDTDLRITATGDVGIGLGATDPSAKLHVNGNMLVEDPTSDGSSDHLLEVKSGSSATPDNARILVSADTDAKLPMFNLRDVEANGGTFTANYSAYIALDRATPIVTGSAQNDMLIANGNYNKDIHLCTNNAGNGLGAQARLTIVGSDGDVGIGTTSPAQKLHVNGTIRQTVTSAVLVANANGDLVAASNLTDTAYSTTDTTDAAVDVYSANPAYWAFPPPTTVAEALDRIAAHLNNPAFSPPGPIP